MGLLAKASVAIDGSKFKAVNNRDKNFTVAKIERRKTQAAKEVLKVDTLEAVADRGYFNGEEIKTCDAAGITVTLPKPMTSGAKSDGRFGKQDFVFEPEADVYRCPAGETLKYYYTKEEKGQKFRMYWTNACRTCPLKAKCTPGKERRISRWEHEEIVEDVQKRLDKNPDAMRTRRETVEHPFGTMKMRMGATHFLCKTLPKVATEMALCVLTYNLTRVLEPRRRGDADGGDCGMRGRVSKRCLAAVLTSQSCLRAPSTTQTHRGRTGKICSIRRS